jgi:hypothetical protein
MPFFVSSPLHPVIRFPISRVVPLSPVSTSITPGRRRMRRLRRFAAWAAAILALAWMVAVLASPAARRGYGLWLTARGMRMPGDAHERAAVSAYVDHMPRLCLNRPCEAAWPLTVMVTTPAGEASLEPDSAWIIAGPAVYGMRMRTGLEPHRSGRREWGGSTGSLLPLELMRVGVIVRFRELGNPPRVLRFWAVPVGSAG